MELTVEEILKRGFKRYGPWNNGATYCSPKYNSLGYGGKRRILIHNYLWNGLMRIKSVPEDIKNTHFGEEILFRGTIRTTEEFNNILKYCNISTIGIVDSWIELQKEDKEGDKIESKFDVE